MNWERRRRQNSWFDALCNACPAGHYGGVKLVGETPKPPKPRRALAEMQRASNREVRS